MARALLSSAPIMAWIGHVVLLAALVMPLRAHAQSVGAIPTPDSQAPSSVSEPQPPTSELERNDSPRRYFWQTLLADAASLGTLGIGVSQKSLGVSLVGGLVYVVGTPAIHIAHRNGWALPSLLLRAAAPALIFGGVELAFGACDFGDRSCGAGAIGAGIALSILGIGLAIAMPVIDAILAVEPARPSKLALAPWLAPHAEAGGLMLMGRL